MLRNKISLFFLFFFLFIASYGQQVPYRPVSHMIFTPAVFNPAITGSRDATEISIITGTQKFYNTQLLSGSSRLFRKNAQNSFIPDISSFSNIGVGGYFYHYNIDSVRNLGGALSGSYHLPLDRDALSFLSVGLSAKGIYSHKYSYSEEPDTGQNTTFTPDLDAGIFYYNPRFYIGLSATNIFSSPSDSGFSTHVGNNASRQFLGYFGYRFVVSRTNALVLEPFLFVNYGDFSMGNQPPSHFHPGLRFYYKGSYVGTYLNDPKNFAFFMHLEFQGFFIGSYVEFPMNPDTPWKNDKLFLELSAGIHLRTHKKEFMKYW